MRFLLLFSCILIFRSQADVRRKVGKSGGQIGIQGLLSEMVLFLLELVSIMSKIWWEGRQVPPFPLQVSAALQQATQSFRVQNCC